MRAKTARLLAILARAALLAGRLLLLYTRIRLRLAAWKAYSKLAFRVKTRSLPPPLRRELRREYSRLLSEIQPPPLSPRIHPRRPRRSGGGVNG